MLVVVAFVVVIRAVSRCKAQNGSEKIRGCRVGAGSVHEEEGC